MQANIFSLIEELVTMSGSNSNFDTLDSELIIINQELPRLEEELKELSASISDEKYFDASQEIVDRNIEISVSKKLTKLEKEYDQLKQKIDKLELEEQKYFEIIDSLKQKIIKTKKNLALIDERITNSKNQDSKSIYSNLFEEEQDKIDGLQNELKYKNQKMLDIDNEIQHLTELNNKTKKSIEQATSRLLEVRKSLSSKSSYVDETLKNKDNELQKELTIRINDLKEKKEKILTDPCYLGNEIKELLISEKTDLAFEKLAILVNVIKEMPYMTINDTLALEEELRKLEDKQREFLVSIEHKNYYGEDLNFIENRIAYLKMLNETKKESIETVKKEISYIDNNLVLKVSNELKNADNKASELEKSIREYDRMLSEEDKKPTSVKASLKATCIRKHNELKIINELIQKYTTELSSLIEESSYLENIKIEKINAEIIANTEEIDSLKKIKLMSAKSKDTIEQELDKKEIKQMAEDIKKLKHRLSFEKTPGEVFDELEMILAQNKFNDNLTDTNEEKIELSVEKNEQEPINLTTEDFNAIGFDNISLVQEPQIPTFEEIKEILPQNDFVNNIEINENNITSQAEDVINIDDIQSVKLDEIAETTIDEEENEYTLSELEDTDYFSLDEFLKSIDDKKEE